MKPLTLPNTALAKYWARSIYILECKPCFAINNSLTIKHCLNWNLPIKHLLLSNLLAFSISFAFAADADKNKPMPKCTADHVPIALKTNDGKSYTAFIMKDHAKDLKEARGVKALHHINIGYSIGFQKPDSSSTSCTRTGQKCASPSPLSLLVYACAILSQGAHADITDKPLATLLQNDLAIFQIDGSMRFWTISLRQLVWKGARIKNFTLTLRQPSSSIALNLWGLICITPLSSWLIYQALAPEL